MYICRWKRGIKGGMEGGRAWKEGGGEEEVVAVHSR